MPRAGPGGPGPRPAVPRKIGFLGKRLRPPQAPPRRSASANPEADVGCRVFSQAFATRGFSPVRRSPIDGGRPPPPQQHTCAKGAVSEAALLFLVLRKPSSGASLVGRALSPALVPAPSEMAHELRPRLYFPPRFLGPAVRRGERWATYRLPAIFVPSSSAVEPDCAAIADRSPVPPILHHRRWSRGPIDYLQKNVRSASAP